MVRRASRYISGIHISFAPRSPRFKEEREELLRKTAALEVSLRERDAQIVQLQLRKAAGSCGPTPLPEQPASARSSGYASGQTGSGELLDASGLATPIPLYTYQQVRMLIR